MEVKKIKRLQLKYDIDNYKKKRSIARTIVTQKSELNKLMNKRTKSTHQKKISSMRTGTKNATCNGKGIFTIKRPNYRDCYNRDGSIFSSNKKHTSFHLTVIFIWKGFRNLEKVIKKNKVYLYVRLHSIFVIINLT